ncbi:MAG: glycosyltransferase [Lentisphaeria bacterium]|nr:glycosyltransferase [Lentisphaeria bacterium]
MILVFFSGVGYGSFVGGRTVRLARELSKDHEVHFVEMPSPRRWRIGTRKQDGLFVHTLPPGSQYLFFRRNKAYLSDHIPLRKAHLIVSQPVWGPFTATLQAACLHYDCLDHVSIHAPGRKGEFLARCEEDLIRRADRIFAVSPELVRLLNSPEKCRLLPNAAPDELKGKVVSPPKEQNSPVIGFHGALYEWIDYALLEEIAEAFPECRLRLAGDVRNKSKLKNLKRHPNVENLPAFRFEKLSEIVSSFTLGIVPFLDNVVTCCSDPLKHYEYLAMGRRVVSTVKANFPAPRKVFRCAKRESFLAELREMLGRIPDAEACRKAVEGQFWSDRCGELVRLLRECES